MNMKYEEANLHCRNQSNQYSQLALVDSVEKLVAIGNKLRDDFIEYAMIDMRMVDGVYMTSQSTGHILFGETGPAPRESDYKCDCRCRKQEDEAKSLLVVGVPCLRHCISFTSSSVAASHTLLSFGFNPFNSSFAEKSPMSTAGCGYHSGTWKNS